MHRQVGQGTANEVELLDLRSELEGKEQKYEEEKGKKKDTAQGIRRFSHHYLPECVCVDGTDNNRVVPSIPTDKLRRLEENKKLLLLGDSGADARESQLKSVASKYDDADDADDSDASSDSDSDRCALPILSHSSSQTAVA